jgi:hypothetical protein
MKRVVGTAKKMPQLQDGGAVVRLGLVVGLEVG